MADNNIFIIYSNKKCNMKLEKRSNGHYVWTSLMVEVPCHNLMEVFKVAKDFIEMPLATVELALLEMERMGDNVAEFDEHNCFIKTSRYDN